MALPSFNEQGDLPQGIHRATIKEVRRRFGTRTAERRKLGKELLRLFDVAVSTGKLDRLIVFGSFVTDEPKPNDVDVVLVMRDDFRVKACPQDARP